jgi:hypothetical protein
LSNKLEHNRSGPIEKMMPGQAPPTSAADCVTLLQSVLACLDQANVSAPTAYGDAMSVAAAHVQQAIELIQAAEQADA